MICARCGYFCRERWYCSLKDIDVLKINGGCPDGKDRDEEDDVPCHWDDDYEEDWDD